MSRRLALGLLLILAGCNRSGVADVTLDADATQRNATAAKTLGDLAAATAASRGPAPLVRDAAPVSAETSAREDRAEEQQATKPADATPASDADQAETPSNDAADADAEAR